MSKPPPDKLSIVVFSGDFEKVHYALVMASAAAAINTPVTLFFTMGACRVLADKGPDGEAAWRSLPVNFHSGLAARTGGDVDDHFKQTKVAHFEELLLACAELGVRFLVCEMGLRAMDLEEKPLRDDLPIEQGGVVTFIEDASNDGAMIFI